MKDNIISFSTKVKKEMLLTKPTNENEIISELYGIFMSKDAIIENKVNFKTEISYIAKRVLENLKNLSYTNFKYSIEKITNHNIYIITIEKFTNFSNINKIWFLKGVFLGNGYIKDPIKGYSIDFFLHNNELANTIYQILKDENKKVFISKKKDQNIIYIRNSEDIMDLLVLFNAINIFFAYQNTTINKEINLKITRNMNYELANETKKILTSSEQINIIKKIDEELGIENLNKALKEVALVRLKNEDASLQELAEKLNITKSGIRNRFRRLKEIYERFD